MNKLAAMLLAGGLICALVLQTGSVMNAQPSQPETCQPPSGLPRMAFAEMRDLRIRAWQFLLQNSRQSVYNSPDWVPKATAFRRPWDSTPKFQRPPLYFSEESAAAGFPPSTQSRYPSQAATPDYDALVYESTFFNLAAVRHIENEHYPLYGPNQATMTRLLSDSRTEIPEFPKDSVVMKTFWRPVHDKGKGSVKVGVWDWTSLKKDEAGAFPETAWGHERVCVELDSPDGAPCIDAATKFVTIKTTEENGPGFTCPTSDPAKCPKLQKGTTLILLGIHTWRQRRSQIGFGRRSGGRESTGRTARHLPGRPGLATTPSVLPNLPRDPGAITQ